MRFLDLLFGRRTGSAAAGSNWEAAFVREFPGDLPAQGRAEDEASGLRSLEDLLEAQCMTVVDWADAPNDVVDTILGTAAPNLLRPDALARVIAQGDSILAKKGRGAGTYPTIVSLDGALAGTGRRLIWVDQSGDSYVIGVVSDRFLERWGDVRLTKDFASLVPTVENEVGRNRRLADAPRDVQTAS